MIFIQRPISATLLVVSAVLLMILIFPAIRAKREQALQE
jgi:TctA family transporter